MRTMLLDQRAWDLVLDAKQNIAIANDPYSQAQDAASAIRTFKGNCYYNTAIGTPFGTILGKSPSLALLKTSFEDQAKLVPGVVKAKCFISGVVNRTLTGQVQVTTDTGQTSAASF